MVYQDLHQAKTKCDRHIIASPKKRFLSKPTHTLLGKLARATASKYIVQKYFASVEALRDLAMNAAEGSRSTRTPTKSLQSDIRRINLDSQDPRDVDFIENGDIIRSQQQDESSSSCSEDDVEGSSGEVARLSSDLLLVYNFFLNQSARTLKTICEQFKLKKSGNKKEVIARLVVYVQSKAESRTPASFAAVIRKSKACATFASFNKEAAKKWEESDVPTLEQLKSDAGVCDEEANSKKGGRQDEGERVRVLTLDELARLLLVLQDPIGREALRKTRRSLTAAELDANISRFAPWYDVIAKKFNDPAFAARIKLDGYGHLRNVDASRPPSEHVNGGSLRKEFTDLRPKFTTLYEDCCSTGQNSSENFLDYVVNKRGFVTVMGKKMVIIHELLRCDKPNVDEDLFTMVSKKVDDPLAGDEEGLDDVDRVMALTGSAPSASFPSSSGSQKRARESYEDMLKENTKLQKEGIQVQSKVASGITDLVQVMKSTVTVSNPTVQVNTNLLALFEQVKKSKENLEEAQQRGDQRHILRAQVVYQKMEADLDKLMMESGMDFGTASGDSSTRRVVARTNGSESVSAGRRSSDNPTL